MDDRYRSAYQAIYSSRTDDEFPPPYPPVLGAVDRSVITTPVRQAINAADGELGESVRLREDARALLAVDFQDLVMLPLITGGRVAFADLTDDVAADVGLLAREASAMMPRNESEVSGHRIIDALSQNWTNLRIARYGLWEEST
jgi:hypothetical protein